MHNTRYRVGPSLCARRKNISQTLSLSETLVSAGWCVDQCIYHSERVSGNSICERFPMFFVFVALVSHKCIGISCARLGFDIYVSMEVLYG